MQKRIIDRPKIIIYLFAFMGALGAGTPTGAREIEIDGKPCNELCQAWLGYEGNGDLTLSTTEYSKSRVQSSTPPSRPTASARSLRTRRPEKETVYVERHHPAAQHPAPEVPRTVVAAKHVRPRFQKAQAKVSLPVPQPVMPSGGLASAAGAPMSAASRSSASPRKFTEAAALPEADMTPSASIIWALPPMPDRPAPPDTSKLQKEPPLTAAPTAAVAPPSPGASSPPQMPNIVTAATHGDVTKPSPDTKAAPQTPIDAGDEGRPDDQATPASKPATAQPSTVMASLPSPVNAGSSLRNDDHQSGSTQEGNLQPIPELTGTPLPFTVGRISAEPRGTDVHVVMVNVLQREIKDVDVRCRARDAEGLQVAEASTHIASIAPSDVAFGQVFFPAEITAQNNKFTCEVGRITAADDVTP